VVVNECIGPCALEERLQMWKNSKLGLVRQIAANDRKGPPANNAVPAEVTEAGASTRPRLSSTCAVSET